MLSNERGRSGKNAVTGRVKRRRVAASVAEQAAADNAGRLRRISRHAEALAGALLLQRIMGCHKLDATHFAPTGLVSHRARGCYEARVGTSVVARVEKRNPCPGLANFRKTYRRAIEVLARP